MKVITSTIVASICFEQIHNSNTKIQKKTNLIEISARTWEIF